MSHRTLESHIKLPLGQVCACLPGACWASPDGKARGRVSSISDMACRDAGPNTFTVRQDMLLPGAARFDIPQMVATWRATPGAAVHPELAKMVDEKSAKIRAGMEHAALATPALARQEGGSHYKDMKIQPIEFIHANGIPFCEGSVIKYVSRWRAKGGVADLKKARHFLDLLIELEGKTP